MYTISDAKSAVKEAIKGYLYKDEEGHYVMEERNRLPIYLEGAPGIGKTEIVEQISRELGLGFVSFSMVHHSRNSLLGLPVINVLKNGDKYTTYTISEVIAKVDESVGQGNSEGILLLDEFPCMSETVMPAMLAFLQTKNIGLHYLPEGWVIVLCGNPQEYNKASKKFDASILDRIRKIEVEFDAQCFISYGKEQGLEDVILSYLELQPSHAYRCSNEKGETELVTCRGWENLSHAIKIYNKLEQTIDGNMIGQFIKSVKISNSFLNYYRQWQIGLTIKEIDDILSGTGFKKYREKITNELNYRQQWLLTDYLCERLGSRDTKEETGAARYKEIAGWMSNVLDMIKEIDGNGILCEKAFRIIGRSELLLKVVSSVKVPEYLELCDRFLADAGELVGV
jgi:hypothetical protein